MVGFSVEHFFGLSHSDRGKREENHLTYFKGDKDETGKSIFKYSLLRFTRLVHRYQLVSWLTFITLKMILNTLRNFV